MKTQTSTLAVTPWLLAICAGVIVALCARLLGVAGNPLGVMMSWPSILVTVGAALVAGWGIACMVRARKTRDTLRNRKGALFVLVGIFTLMASYVGRMALPIMLGVGL